MLTIGEVAKRAGVSVETVRFYERKALIAKPARTPSRYRQYSPDTVRCIRFIQQAKAVGFTLKDITELLSLRASPGASCADVRQRASAKIEDIDGRIRELVRMREALVRLTEECSGAGPVSACPILELLDAAETTADR